MLHPLQATVLVPVVFPSSQQTLYYRRDIISSTKLMLYHTRVWPLSTQCCRRQQQCPTKLLFSHRKLRSSTPLSVIRLINPMVPVFGSFVPMQSYATSPVCLPGFLPGMSSFYNPQVHPTQPVYPTNLSSSVNLMGNTSSLVTPKFGKWGGSMCSSPQQASSSQRSHLQSVPPWFLFSDKRADSKVKKWFSIYDE